MQAQRPGLWHNPDFVKLWVAQTISKFGSHIGYAALQFTAILNLRATPSQMGLLSAMGSAPLLLVGLFAGVWVDRRRRRPILVAADIGRALVLSTIPLAVLLGELRIGQLYLVAALTGVLSVFFGVADQSALPALVRREQLMDANSKLGASDSVAEVGGPALAGTLVQWLSAPVAILLDAVSFLVSALYIGLIRAPEPPPVKKERRESVRREIGEGLRTVWDNRYLRSLTISAALASFFGNFIGALYGLFLIRELGLTPVLVGISVGAGGVGALLGALLAGPVTRRFGMGPTLVGSRFLPWCIGFGLPLVSGPKAWVVFLIMAVQLVGDVPFAIHAINEASLRQAIIPHHLLGRANASMDFLTRGVGPLGALVGGALGALIGMRLTLLTAVIGGLASSLYLYFSPIRALRELPTPAGEPVGS